jgi:spore coat polysaccharide biosynthesis protein SpsF
MSKIGCIIQARMGSTRLPGKVLMQINNKPMLHYLIKQLEFSKEINEIVIATTNLEEDLKIIKFAKKNNIEFFIGSNDDVLDRYYQCAKEFSFSDIVRITADNPLIDPHIVNKVIRTFKDNTYDYVSNTIVRTFPYGTEVEVFSFNALENAWKNAHKHSEREHVTPFIYKNKFRIFNVTNKINLSRFRWTVDIPNDLKLVKEIILKNNKFPITTEIILNILKENPDLVKINEKNIQNKKDLKSLKIDEGN